MALTPPGALPPLDPSASGAFAFQALYGSMPEALFLGWGLNTGFWNAATLGAMARMSATQVLALVTEANAAGLGGLPDDHADRKPFDAASAWLASRYPDPIVPQIDGTE